jgi:hypothetical protein
MRLGILPLLLVALVGTGKGTEPAPVPEPAPAPETSPAPETEELRAVIVEEEGDTVEVWVDLPASVDPGSVEVQLAGRVVAVRARDVAGRMLRSAPLHVREPVVEDDAAARTEGSWLVVELRKDLAPPSL